MIPVWPFMQYMVMENSLMRHSREPLCLIPGPPGIHSIINEQRSFVISDTRQYPGWALIPGTEHVISWMGVPLIAGGRIIGIYSIDKAEADFFTEEHQKLAEALAGQAAVAIQNARLFTHIQGELAERRTLKAPCANLKNDIVPCSTA